MFFSPDRVVYSLTDSNKDGRGGFFSATKSIMAPVFQTCFTLFKIKFIWFFLMVDFCLFK